MNEIYKIKKGHPIKEVIRKEIYKGYYEDNNIDIAIGVSSIEDCALCSYDIYDFKFNGNNDEVPCINVSVFKEAKDKNAPKILEDIRGYDYYKVSCSTTIKLKTFLEKNPEWSDLKKWTTKVKVKKEKCVYDGHNSESRHVALRRPDGKKYEVPFPEDEKTDSNVLDWIKPFEEQLTKQYYRNISLDKLNNIKRELTVWVEGMFFLYDYRDGTIDIRDITTGYHRTSIYKTLTESKLLDISIGVPEETKKLIKNEIESRDLEVKDIILGEYRPETKRIKVEL